MTPTHTFRVVWPLLDATVPAEQIAAEVVADLPAIAATTRVRQTGPGRSHLASAARTPGAPRVTDHVLIYEAPAVPAPPPSSLRPYAGTASASTTPPTTAASPPGAPATATN